MNAQTLLSRLLPAMATLGAAALLAWSAFNVFVLRYPAAGVAQEAGVTLRSRPRPAAADTRNLAQIPDWHLFGDSERPPGERPPQKVIEAPTTPLALTLQGTFRGKSDTEESWAIISSSDNEQAMYRVGDKIPGGATLFAVEPFRVILERNGRHESLSLPRPSMDEAPQATTTTTRPPRRIPPAAIPPGSATPTTDRHRERQALIEEMARIRKKFAR